jgi:hypothetical protein
VGVDAPGAVVHDLAVVLADGGTTISDIETLRRRQPALFAKAASEPTAWRTIEALAADELALTRLFDAVAATREESGLARCTILLRVARSQHGPAGR